MVPETRYTQSEGINVAYQVFGHGPLDLVVAPGWVSNIEVFWEEPSVARFFNNLASFSRVILFDKRGTGLSDRVVAATTLEERMDDVRAVMDAAASKRVALFGYSEGGPMSALFAATYPARTSALIMLGSYARRTRAPDYPYGPDDEQMQAWFDLIVDNWGGPVGLEERAPTLAQDDRFRLWWARYLRLSASPSSVRALTLANGQIDVRHVLPSIRVPTLILHADKDQAIEAGHSYYLAKAIPNAKQSYLTARIIFHTHLGQMPSSAAFRSSLPGCGRRRRATVYCVQSCLRILSARLRWRLKRGISGGATCWMHITMPYVLNWRHTAGARSI